MPSQASCGNRAPSRLITAISRLAHLAPARRHLVATMRTAWHGTSFQGPTAGLSSSTGPAKQALPQNPLPAVGTEKKCCHAARWTRRPCRVPQGAQSRRSDVMSQEQRRQWCPTPQLDDALKEIDAVLHEYPIRELLDLAVPSCNADLQSAARGLPLAFVESCLDEWAASLDQVLASNQGLCKASNDSMLERERSARNALLKLRSALASVGTDATL